MPPPTPQPSGAARVRGHRPPQGEPVVDRALAILGAFDERHLRLSLADLARRTEMPVSTVRRLALRLTEWGALEKDDQGRYSIGLRLWEVGSLADRNLSLRDVASPFLDDLNAATHAHTQLAVRDEDSVIVLDRRLGEQRDLPVRYRLGERIPIVASAVGMVLLAYADTDVQDAVLASEFRWPVHECPRPSPGTVRRHLADVRHTGSARVERATSPVASVAVPVKGVDSNVVAAIGCVVLSGTSSLAALEQVARAAAMGVSRRLGAKDLRRLPTW